MLELILICLAKVIEVSLSTLRMVCITKGNKVSASIIGFIEVMIWLKVASVVLVGITDAPEKMIVYALGFALGTYLGLFIEDALALGFVTLQVIIDIDKGHLMADWLRDKKIGVTLLHAEGRDKDKNVLILYVKKKRKKTVIKEIEKEWTEAVITVTDTQAVFGGYGLLRK